MEAIFSKEKESFDYGNMVIIEMLKDMLLNDSCLLEELFTVIIHCAV